MNEGFLKKLVPGVIEAVKGLNLSREVVAMTLKELGNEILEGKHIPNEALDRANKDQLTLDKLFKE